MRELREEGTGVAGTCSLESEILKSHSGILNAGRLLIGKSGKGHFG
jgi:hypothetical protein